MREVNFQSFEVTGEPVPQLGKPMRKELCLDFEDCKAFCNQGSYGICPKRVVEYRNALSRQMESSPDRFFRYNARSDYDFALAAASNFVGSYFGNMVFVNNVTTGLNTAIRESERAILLAQTTSDNVKVLITSLTYHATGFMAEHLAERMGAKVVVVDMKFPIESEEDVLDRFRQACVKNPGVAVAIIDHISSTSTVLWPVKKIAMLLKGWGVKRIIVDGAHAPAQVRDLNLEHFGKAGVDFYSGNLHKWALAPRGCAILWCRSGLQDYVMPHNTSHLHYQTYQDRFYEQGTMDYSNYLAVPASLIFIKSIGGLAAMHNHATQLLDWAQDMLVKALKTKALPAPKSMGAPYMRIIALPKLRGLPKADYNSSWRLSEEMLTKYNIAQYITEIDGRFWIRISAGIFNDKADYVMLKDALLDLCNKRK